MNNKLAIKPPVIISGVSTLFSALSFIVMYINHFMTAYSLIIILICFITIILCLIIHKQWMDSLLIFASFLLFLSLLSNCFAKIESHKAEERELISDVTYCIAEQFKNKNEDWVYDAINRGNLYFVLIPSSKNIKQFLYDINENLNSIGYFRLQYNVCLLLAEMQSKIIYGKYLILMTDLSEIELLNKRHCYWTVLPHSCLEVALGQIDMNNHNYQSAKEHYFRADSLGNATGTYLLSKWYATGYNMYPDENKESELLKKAASRGSRAARMDWGKKTLISISATEWERGEAEDYLLRSSRIRMVAYKYTIDVARESVKILDEYYRTEDRFRDAYNLTKKSHRYFQDDMIKYNNHLDNCLSMGRYDEALDIVIEGEKKNYPYCFFTHAIMIMNGLGTYRDYSKAEHLLRFAADSLNYRLSYRGLADLYRKTNRSGVDFWEDLYDANFDNRIEE